MAIKPTEDVEQKDGASVGSLYIESKKTTLTPASETKPKVLLRFPLNLHSFLTELANHAGNLSFLEDADLQGESIECFMFRMRQEMDKKENETQQQLYAKLISISTATRLDLVRNKTLKMMEGFDVREGLTAPAVVSFCRLMLDDIMDLSGKITKKPEKEEKPDSPVNPEDDDLDIISEKLKRNERGSRRA